ncbi:transporter [Ganoderma sinense ZZ0214-1]|uniref:Potassium transport protein n=1 Tax=Ganoderma sinense ZZ0214-1 TaxID=1077348 RepID=A0A2G8SMZ0_9APHY|nr:transporter [Ganoderma sinense ZZ0214-1]
MASMSSLNFYRLHLLTFIIIPLIGSLILWGSNGEFPVNFVDALFICVSAATGTGLVTVDLSSLTVWQQVILVILELVGNQAFVAWAVVIVRRWYFLRHLRHIVAAEMHRTSTRQTQHDTPPYVRHIRETLARFKRERDPSDTLPAQPKPARLRTVRPDMVRRLDIPPQPINPMGSQTHLEDGVVIEASGSDARPRAASRCSHRATGEPLQRPIPPAAADDDFGGFPGIQEIARHISQRLPPQLQQRLQRTLTMPRTETLVPQARRTVITPEGPVKLVSYFSFPVTVKRNSLFHGLKEEHIEELGGVEYRALSALMWIIPAYYIGLLTISFVVVAPYMLLPKWQVNFYPPLQHRPINPVWFSAFQVFGAWANTGMSLVDQSMVPFQTAYPLVIFMVICALAGNTCLPIFLRMFIWLLTKLPGRSRGQESLHFLLDHPRRCTIYLLPSRQTWLLFGIVMLLNCTNLVLDLVFNIGNPATDSLPAGVRVLDAIMNAAACRNAGWQPIPISSLVPATQVLFVIMMYIGIYPIAMSVRATNVYEEKSLGVYEETSEDDDELNDDARWNSSSESRVAIWGRYLMRHARRQLSFGINDFLYMWWLALSLLLLCIIERDNLMNPSKISYFNIFALIFEVVSAYGTVGLSLGIPGLNYSLSGGMHTLSKLVISVVMLRGRHRGLPVALDRAVLMPSEFLTTRSTAPPPEDQLEVHEKNDEHDPRVENESPPVVQQDKDELAELLRLRTRTISLQIPENGPGHTGYVSELRREVSAPSSLAEGLSEDDGFATPNLEGDTTTELEDSAHT